MTSQNNQGGTVGLAWMGVACYYDKGYRTSVNEYFYSDLDTAQVKCNKLYWFWELLMIIWKVLKTFGRFWKVIVIGGFRSFLKAFWSISGAFLSIF